MSQISIAIDATVSLNSGVNQRTLEPFVYLSITANKGFMDLSWTIEKSSKHALMNLLGNQKSINIPILCSLEVQPTNVEGEYVEYVVCEYIVDDVSLVFAPRDKSTKRTIKAMLDKYREELRAKLIAQVESPIEPVPVAPTSKPDSPKKEK